jgi:nucleoside-diphosphate kinase
VAYTNPSRIAWSRTVTQRTLVLLKPDAVRRGLSGEIISRIERKAGWQLAAVELRTFDRATLEQHYAEHVGKPFYEPLLTFMSEGPSIALIVEGENVIPGVRALAGATDPLQAGPGTIRGDYATITRENLIHASDSPESAEREIKIFFPAHA